MAGPRFGVPGELAACVSGSNSRSLFVATETPLPPRWPLAWDAAQAARPAFPVGSGAVSSTPAATSAPCAKEFPDRLGQGAVRRQETEEQALPAPAPWATAGERDAVVSSSVEGLGAAGNSVGLLPQHLGVVRRLSVGSGRRGALVQLELAGGELEGAVLLLEQGDGSSVRVEIQLPSHLGAPAALELKEQLARKGVDIESFEVH